ncbi:MAG TPA: GNAT family N-acetyltransferase, partial [Caulifigura sp.]|nr:GNAT family N-acetyltransferase [Caulifigura sp.]
MLPFMEVRTYEGTARELSDFVIGVWRDAYAGRMQFPLWTAEYLDWQLDFGSPASRENLLAAYCDGQLAGVLLGWNYCCRRGERRDPAVLSSWLSVRPEFRGRGVVKALKAEQDARMIAKGNGLIFAYRYYGSEYSLSKGPTPDQLASGRWDSRRVGFWVRI